MGETASAHGLDGRLVEPDWAPLAMDEVRALLSQFSDCGEPVEILSSSPRPFSAASVVRTQSGSVFVKRHHRSVRDREGLLEEHRFLRHLQAHGAAVPRVLEDARGETAVESGEWTYEVHDTPAIGVDLYREAFSWTPFSDGGTCALSGRGVGAAACGGGGVRGPAAQGSSAGGKLHDFCGE
jgi:hypothetical protein